MYQIIWLGNDMNKCKFSLLSTAVLMALAASSADKGPALPLASIRYL